MDPERLQYLVDVSDTLYFNFWPGEKEEVAGGVLIENRRRGGVLSKEEAREGEGLQGNVRGEGTSSFFFGGRNSH